MRVKSTRQKVTVGSQFNNFSFNGRIRFNGTLCADQLFNYSEFRLYKHSTHSRLTARFLCVKKLKCLIVILSHTSITFTLLRKLHYENHGLELFKEISVNFGINFR